MTASLAVWREDNADIFPQTVAAAAGQLGIQPLAVEKDYWVCQALRAIEEHAPGEVVFKGGTSLEKLRLIERFSEDLDLLVIGSYPTEKAIGRALKRMCEAAMKALPGSVAGAPQSGGEVGWKYRRQRLNVPMSSPNQGTAIADPGAILLEFGQSGGPNPFDRRPVTTLFARRLQAGGGVDIDQFIDLAPFEVQILHPGRTLIEKLLRINNFVVDENRRTDAWPRIGRQFYDIWALLGEQRVLEFLSDKEQASEVLQDAMAVSQAFRYPDLPPPDGGFARCDAFDPGWSGSQLLRAEHGAAIRELYYGAGTVPTFDQVIERISEMGELLDVG